MGEILEKVEGVVDVNTHVLLGNPDIVVRPDSVQTARVGLTELDVESQLNAALYGQVASTVPEQDRMTKIRVRYPDHVRFDRENLGQLPDQPGDGYARRRCRGSRRRLGRGGYRLRPAGQLASIRVVRSPNELWRENQQPVLTVTARLDKRDIGSVNRELESKLAALKFPPGYRWELAGSYRAQQESFQSLLVVLIVAAALVFLLMGFQFRSVILPIRLFLVQPISLVSAMFALWITGTPLNVSSFMGAILLIGLDVKNEIILIEYIGQLREQGHAASCGPAQGRADPVPADPDDEPLHDSGPGPAGDGTRPGSPDAAAAGHRRDRRPDHQHAAHPAPDPGRLPGLEGTRGSGVFAGVV